MFNVPNVITIIRILLVPTYLVFMYSRMPYSDLIACVLFSIAGFTDLLDGYLARKYGQVTNLGKIMDPVADKIMVTAAMVALVEMGRLSGWIVIVMLFRDFAVGALRDIAAQQGTVIAADRWGKLKTILQMVALGFLIFYHSVTVWPLSVWGLHPGEGISVVSGYITIPTFAIGTGLIYIALMASVFSGIMYFKNNYRLIYK